MARTYRVGVIGRTGRGNYGHGLDVVWKRIDKVEIVAVADENEAGRKAAQARLGAKNAYADYRQMLEKERPQIVSVACRHLDPHRDMVVACARAGASIFLEKPMARTLEEADEMVRACEMHHVKLAIAHQTRYSPTLARIKEMIAAGMLGDLLEMHGRGKGDRRGGGEDLMVLGTHIMDLMRVFAGDASWCFARVLQDGKPITAKDVHPGGEGMGPIAGNHITATYGFAKGLQGTFGTTRARDGASTRFGLRVLGSKGAVMMSTGSLPRAFFLADPSWGLRTGKVNWQPISSAGLNKPEPITDSSLTQGDVWIAQDLIEAIEKDRQPLGSMYDGRAALEMILATYESQRQGKPVELPLKNRKHPLTLLSS
jgi:predicted dehydrogenase